MTSSSNAPAVVLVPGHWLGAWAWDDVAAPLRAAGHHVVPLTLPGLDPDDADRLTRTVDDQAAALEQVLDGLLAAHGPSVLVAHSGANAPASVLLDRRPELVSHVVWVDSGPVGSGVGTGIFIADDAVDEPLPDFEALGQTASLEDLGERDLAEFRRRAVSQPATVIRGEVVLVSGAGADVPMTMVCCSIPADVVRTLAADGVPMFAAVARCTQATLVDLQTGHWPMWSRPKELADVIAAVR